MNVTTFEAKIWEIDGIRVVVRAKWDKEIGDFLWENKAAHNTSISNWFDNRILSKIGDCTAVVIDGSGQFPHGRTSLDKVRNSYA